MAFCTLDSAALALSQTDLSSPQQSWMSNQSVNQRMTLTVTLLKLLARLLMLAVDWV
jgi:hypothetical protein